ncbi:GGDEF domain-containing response regulator [Thiohalorhabdus sp. Cl-TMA]|uniref:Diguanylate cyclase domain-containing protein n=1 Tax=Thiohalorhabdus methylotrophus TaxID=3242694 RepID=A0ABV4TUF2_9GAMM
MWIPSGSDFGGSGQVPRLGREGGLLASPVGTRKERAALAPPLKLLLVSNNSGLIRLIRTMLPAGPKSRIQMQTCDRLAGALARLRYQPFDVVLLDLVLPDCRGLPSIQILTRSFPEIPLVVLTGTDEEVPGQAAMEAGAQDYLHKGGMDAELLIRTLRFAVHRQKADYALKKSQESLQTLVENLPDGVVLYNNEGMTFANPAALELFGVSSLAEIQGREVTEFLNCPQDPELAWRLDRVIAGLQPHDEFQEGECLKADGRCPSACKFMAIPLQQARGNQGQLILRDITPRKRADKYLRLATAVFEASAEGMMILDAEGRVEMVNEAFTTMTGYSAEEVVGWDSRFLGAGENGTAFFSKLGRILSEKGHWRGELSALGKSGAVFIARLTVSVVRNELGEATNYVTVFSDVTEEKEREAAIKHLANHDPLTGLPNRRLLHDRLTQALADRHREPQGRDRLALLFVDLDAFKAVNDTYGHEAGDQVLREMAGRMREALREGDTVARFGGDEFVVLLKHLPGEDMAAELARKLFRSMSRPVTLNADGVTVELGASIGIAMAPKHGDQADLLLNRADQAMYCSKERAEQPYYLF